MNISDAGQVGTVSDVVNLIDIFSSIMIAVLPFIGLCLIIYTGYRIKKRLEYRRKINQNKKVINKQIKQEQKVNLTRQRIPISDQQLLSRLDNVQTEVPYNPKFDSLALEFDSNGKII